MVKVITFDLDGVYFPNGKANFIKSLADLGFSEESAKKVFLQSDEMNNQYKKGKMSDSEYWNWAISQWNLNIKWQDLVSTMISGYDVNDQVVDLVKSLRAKGYKTAICTNNFPARINGLQEKYKFLDNFDIKVISYEVGCAKPDKEIFNKLVEYSGVEPSEIVYADDHAECLESSNQLGIMSHLYTDFEEYKNYLQSVGVDVE